MDERKDSEHMWDEAYTRGFADCLYQDEPSEIRDNNDAKFSGERGYRRPKRKKRRGLRALLVLLAVAVCLFGIHQLTVRPPKGNSGTRKRGCSTILLAGTDESGDRTDTVMLLSVNRQAKRISLLSIPRDTWVDSSYSPHKINLAYGVNGKGASGMESLMDYVSETVGFRPDGYLLVDLDVFIDLVDLFGGVEFDVPCSMDYEDVSQNLSIHLQPGMQTLDGYAAMGVVRFRSGYAMADLQRVNVQRDLMMAALDQWATLGNVTKLPAAVKLLREHSVTDLSTGNLLWLAESAAICGTLDMEMMTVPYTLDSTYVYVDASGDYLSIINEYFNPYQTEVVQGDLVLP